MCKFFSFAEVDVPVPQLVEEVVHVPVTQTQARCRPRNAEFVGSRQSSVRLFAYLCYLYMGM